MNNVLRFLFLSLLFYSCKSENYTNLLKINIGMPYKQAMKIMDVAPKKIVQPFWSDSTFVTYYDSPATASDDYGIEFTKKDSIVIKVFYGD